LLLIDFLMSEVAYPSIRKKVSSVLRKRENDKEDEALDEDENDNPFDLDDESAENADNDEK
ncbi:MAG: hypothetical protein J6V77_00085, partial [Clostridia bacterium]|nr:hypothetical protein [Clostridia bacterium]